MNPTDESYAKIKNIIIKDIVDADEHMVVYLVYDPHYETHFALKVIPENRFRQSEINLMNEIDDPSIVRMYNYEHYEGFIYILYSIIKQKNYLDGDNLIRYSCGILKAIQACHNNKIAHLDIKPENILLDDYDRIKICDFGLSIKYENKDTELHYGGSIPFIAPEILDMKPYNPFKADIWSIGVTFFVMATGFFPWIGADETELCQNTLHKKPQLELIRNHEFQKVIGCCLSKNPEKRPTVDQLLNMAIFRQNSLSNQALPTILPRLYNARPRIKHTTCIFKTPKRNSL